MEVKAARRSGFCFGVKRAVDMAFRASRNKTVGIYTLGPIIHNPQVVEKLRSSGVEPVASHRELGKKDVSAVIIRTHGIPAREMERLAASSYKVIDATCPFVKKAQYYAKLLKKEGYRVVILGDAEHPEVRGILSHAGRGAIVVGGSGDFSRIRGKVGVVVQTTQQVETLRKLLSSIVGNVKEMKVYNTICNSTALRIKETVEIAKSVDVMVVVGGKNSANTAQLASLCRDLSVPTYHIETAEEVEDRWLRAAGSVGVTAGASTPDWIIKSVKERIEHTGGKG